MNTRKRDMAYAQTQTQSNFIDSASRNGSYGSGGRGFPVLTAQNLQDLVHISPKIIKVAVPAFQHSPIFGQFPLVQIV